MKHTVISILVAILLINLSSAIEFGLISPEKINFNESFSISISASASENYDVKIFVHDDSKEFCEIYYNGKWQNPYYYLKSVFPQTTEFKIRAYYIGTTNICARLRKTNSSSFTEVCKPITIQQDDNQTGSPQPATPANLSQSSAHSNLSQLEIQETKRADFIPSYGQSQEQENLSMDNEKISLNSQKNDSSFSARQEKTNIYIAYAFVILCVFIIIFLILRKL